MILNQRLLKLTKPVSVIHKDEKILTKILVDRTEQSVKRIISHDQVEFISGIQNWSVFKNQSNLPY